MYDSEEEDDSDDDEVGCVLTTEEEFTALFDDEVCCLGTIKLSFRYSTAVAEDKSLARGGLVVPRISGTGAPKSSLALSGTSGTKMPSQINGDIALNTAKDIDVTTPGL
jgi:hypothetical protein